MCPEPGRKLLGARFALQPALEEGGHHAVSGPEAGDALANSIDHTCAVRDRDQRQAELWVVASLNDQQIAVVQACGFHLHAHLPRTGLWRRPFNKGEVVNTKSRKPE